MPGREDAQYCLHGGQRREVEPCVGWLKARPVRSLWREVEKDAVRVGFLAFSIKGRT